MFEITDNYGDSYEYVPVQEQSYVCFVSMPLGELLPKLGGIALKVWLYLENTAQVKSSIPLTQKIFGDYSGLEGDYSGLEKVNRISLSKIAMGTGLSESAVKAGLKELKDSDVLN